MADRPADVFIGTLVDVATESESDYQLIIDHFAFASPTLRLQVLCAKSQVAPILALIKSGRKGFWLEPGGVAVAVKITQIKYSTEPVKEGALRYVHTFTS